MIASLRRGLQVQRAFFRLGWLTVVSYPLGFVANNAGAFVPIVLYFFFGRLFESSKANVGGDIFTYLVIGLILTGLLDTGLNGFGAQLDTEIKAGRLEAILVEPVSWRSLPFGLVQFTLVTRWVLALVAVVVSLLLGAHYTASNVPVALVVVMLGILATLGIGILGASVRILAKRTDPVLIVYSLAASVLSGAMFPIELLPRFIRPLAYLIPHTYVIAAVRRLLMPDPEGLGGPSLEASLIGLTLLLFVLYPVALWAFGRTMEYGRKIGALAAY